MAGRLLSMLIYGSTARCSLHSKPSFFSARLSFVLCSFDCSFFGHLFGFRELKKAKFNDNGSKYYGCLSMCHDSLFISLPSFIKGHKTKREIATFCIFERT